MIQSSSVVEVKNGEARVFYNVSGQCSTADTKVDLPSWQSNTIIEVIPGYIVLYIQL